MKACVLTEWKKLEIKDIPIPEPGMNEALVEVIYGGVCGSDVTVFNHNHLTATIPRILCHEILGRVKKINASGPVPYKVGDKVCVFPLEYCGECPACLGGHTSACRQLKIMGLHTDGGFAEYCKAPVRSIIPVPEMLPDRIAALTEPLSVGFHACSKAGVKPNDKVLVIGGGPIGLVCGITAKYFGAKVWLSEVNAERAALAGEMGLETIDPLQEDLNERTRAVTDGIGFDVVLEVSGSQAGYDAMIPACRECGTIVTVAIPSELRAYKANMFILKEIRLLGTRCCPLDEFERTVDMAEYMYRHPEEYPLEKMIAGELPFERIADGIALQQSGKINGKILIRIRE